MLGYFVTLMCVAGALAGGCQLKWSPWSECDSPCGPGQRQRWAEVIHPGNNGIPCPALEEFQPCNSGPCRNPDVDCVFEYSDWTPCDQACNGKQYRWLNVIQQPLGNGRACPFNLEQEQSCNVNALACNPDVDCVFQMGPWSACDALCGQGYQSRSAQIISPPLGRGRACPQPESRVCNTGVSCNPPVDCVEQMGPWSGCSNQCGAGQESRSMQMVTPAQNGGRPCTLRRESRACKSFLSCPNSSRSGRF